MTLRLARLPGTMLWSNGVWQKCEMLVSTVHDMRCIYFFFFFPLALRDPGRLWGVQKFKFFQCFTDNAAPRKQTRRRLGMKSRKSVGNGTLHFVSLSGMHQRVVISSFCLNCNL